MIKSFLSVGYRPAFAYVAFGGEVSHWWTKFLKKGFYHCFLIFGNGREWYIIDPLIHFTDLIIVKTQNIEHFFKEKGYILVRTTPTVPNKIKLSLRPCTCVETVRRFLGVQDKKIWTPYQLFCFLMKKKENNP